MEKGFIYIFTNDAMPGCIKIGVTQRDIKARLKELDTTSVPLPFRCHYAILVEDYEAKEKHLHDAFADHRIRNNREFFRLAPERAVSALKAIGGKEFLSIDNEMIDSDGQVIETKNVIGQKYFPFTACGIPQGAEIIFTRDENKKALVREDNKVEYEGQTYSLSALAKKLLEDMGYHWKSVQGPAYFTYNGDILADIKERKEEIEEG